MKQVKKEGSTLTFQLPRIILELLIVLVIAFMAMQGSRLIVTYLSSSQTIGLPDLYFSQKDYAHDWYLNFVDPGFALFHQIPLNWFWGYGYGPPVIFATLSHLGSQLGLCDMTRESCGYSSYVIMVIVVFGGFIFLSYVLGKTIWERLVTLLFFFIFTLGQGYSRAVVTGNVDLMFSCIFFWCIYLLLRSMRSSRSSIIPALIIGSISGFALSTKLAVLPFVLTFFFAVPKKLVMLILIVISFYVFSMTPQLYGIETKITDIVGITNLTLSAMRKDVYESYPHGNMSVRSTASGMYHKTPIGNAGLPQSLTIDILAIGLIVCITSLGWWQILKIIARKKDVVKKIQTVWHMMVFFIRKEQVILMYSLATISLILFPIVAFEYRLVYFFPVFILLFTRYTDRLSFLFTGAVLFFFIKNVWILHGSFTTLLLYVSLWLLTGEIVRLLIYDYEKSLGNLKQT